MHRIRTVCDAYVKTEANRVRYLRMHQSELRVANYQGLQDYLRTGCEGNRGVTGTPVILPSSFIGSPRYMKQRYQDAMCIVAKYGKPDLFVTMTCNPKWKEIVDNLAAYEQVVNRPDLVTRVF